MKFFHDMPFGARICSGGVRFRLWAPAQRAPKLVLKANAKERALPMAPRDDGWFECITDLARASDRYLYEMDDGRRVPDPASRFQPDDVHGASEVIDPRDYDWRIPDWRGRPWCETVLYELHVGAFAGDYDGAHRKLDHLADLGVTALELMPLADFEGRRNWGYDGVLPFAPDASYGLPEALKGLIDAAHERGLMMFLDVVYNHFGPSGNYLNLYAPQFFTERHHTPWGAAIDFAQPQVREFFVQNALYWLEEYRFDGLRFDAVDQIRDDGETHILEEIAQTVRARIPDRHIHLVLENDNNDAHLLQRNSGATRFYSAQWNDDFHHAAHVLATSESGGYYTDYAQQSSFAIIPDRDNQKADVHVRTFALAALTRALAEGFVYQGEHSAYRNRARGQPSAQLPPLAFVDFLQNHDQIGNRAFGERLANLADTAAIECLTTIWLLAPSIPLFFMGEEWGSKQPFLFFCDYEGELADIVREGRRKEFGKFTSFADPAMRERIPDPNARETFIASTLDWHAAESAAAVRRLDFIRGLLRVRQREVVPRLSDSMHGGRYELVGDRTLRVQWEMADGAALTLVANPAAVHAGQFDRRLPGRRLYAQPSSLPEKIMELPPWSAIWSLG